MSTYNVNVYSPETGEIIASDVVVADQVETKAFFTDDGEIDGVHEYGLHTVDDEGVRFYLAQELVAYYNPGLEVSFVKAS